MGAGVTRAVTAVHAASLLPARRRLRQAAADLAGAQRARLLRLLRERRDTAYAREHGLRDAASVRAFRERAPVVDADAMAPWWERVARGEERVLTEAPVLAMERSGGSTGPAKLVPYTKQLLDELAAAVGPWMLDVYRRFPGVRRGPHYWSVSPVAQGPRRTAGGVRVGFDDDTEYFGPVARWGLRRLLAVPPEVARTPDVEAWRRETARRLVAREDLALVSVWSPTFLSLLLDHAETHLDALLAEAPSSRAARVRRALDAGAALGEALWPRLALVSCWTDAASAAFVPALRARVPHAPIQGKGLLATEGVVSVPLGGRAAPALAAASHFYEFLPVEGGAPVLAHELRAGGRYSPLLTTGGGLSRYHLRDVVACVGHAEGLPLLRFEGRLDDASDLCGEKVSRGQAERALARAAARLGASPRFALLAPSLQGRPHYALYVETAAPAAALDEAAALVDAALAEAHPYRHCRELGQLGPVRAVRVRDGAAARERVLARDGQRPGALKPALLDARPRWDDAFEVAAA